MEITCLYHLRSRLFLTSRLIRVTPVVVSVSVSRVRTLEVDVLVTRR